MASLPEEDFAQIEALCETVEAEAGEVLYEPGQPITYIYFPIDALVSLLAVAEGRMTLEVGSVGREGMIGASVVLGHELAQVRAVEPGYPFYGEIVTAPAHRWTALQRGRNALVDPALLIALDARVGDAIQLGETTFTVIGTLEKVPGAVGIGSLFAPRVYIPARYVRETQLIRMGSRAEYEAYARNALVQLRRVRVGAQLEEDHMRNRQAIVHWLLANTRAIDVRRRDEPAGVLGPLRHALHEGLRHGHRRRRADGRRPASPALTAPDFS